MSRRLFGTDGVRGVANRKLTPELALSLGQAAARWASKASSARRVVVGADTRQSGTMLSTALAAGICSAGLDVLDVGVAPTPAVSYISRTGSFCLGAIVSASHNPAPDNGIKFVGPDGRKLSDSAEEEIEHLLESPAARPEGAGVGSVEWDRKPIESYLQNLVKMIPERLEGWRIAVDCAHGAATDVAPELLKRLGAEVVLTGVHPDGMNINAEGGATKPDTICRLTKSSGAAVGVAFDGDADRAIFCDEQGRLINGDRTMGIWAVHQKEKAKLNPAIVVGTVMSNGGFEKYLTSHGVQLDRAPVGDKYVAERIESTHALIGGEQSGHIIFPAHGPTGDGLATMVELLRVLRLEAKPASFYYDAYDPWPQLLINIAVDHVEGWKEAISAELESAERMLSGKGRIVVRPSGTQPMIRVMTEADDYALRDLASDLITSAMISKLKGQVAGRVDLTYALGD